MAASRVNQTSGSRPPEPAPEDHGTGAPVPDRAGHGVGAPHAVAVPTDSTVPVSVRPAPSGQVRVTRRMSVLDEARRLAGLKWRILRNTLTRSTWVLVGTILGGLYALFILGMLLSGMVFLGSEPLDVVTVVSVLAGSTVLLGWWLMPVLTSKADATLDPSRLALFPLSTTGLLAGQVAGAFIGIPGVLTVVALTGWLFTWRAAPAAMAASVVCAVLAALLAFTGARCASALAARLTKGRRSTEIISVVSLLLIVLLGPIFASVATGVEQVWDRLPTWAAVLGWTPLGAVWAVPGDVGTGHWVSALLRLLVVVLTLGALVVAARVALDRALADAAGGAARATGTSRTGIGLLDRFPARPWAAVAARAAPTMVVVRQLAALPAAVLPVVVLSLFVRVR